MIYYVPMIYLIEILVHASDGRDPTLMLSDVLVGSGTAMTWPSARSLSITENLFLVSSRNTICQAKITLYPGEYGGCPILGLSPPIFLEIRSQLMFLIF
jgi:hypothetical protein